MAARVKPPWWFCCGWWSPWCVLDVALHRVPVGPLDLHPHATIADMARLVRLAGRSRGDAPVTPLLASHAARTDARAIAVTSFVAGFFACLGLVALDWVVAHRMGLR